MLARPEGEAHGEAAVIGAELLCKQSEAFVCFLLGVKHSFAPQHQTFASFSPWLISWWLKLFLLMKFFEIFVLNIKLTPMNESNTQWPVSVAPRQVPAGSHGSACGALLLHPMTLKRRKQCSGGSFSISHMLLKYIFSLFSSVQKRNTDILCNVADKLSEKSVARSKRDPLCRWQMFLLANEVFSYVLSENWTGLWFVHWFYWYLMSGQRASGTVSLMGDHTHHSFLKVGCQYSTSLPTGHLI